MIGFLKTVFPLLLVLSIMGCSDRADREKAKTERSGTEQTIIKSAPEDKKDIKEEAAVKAEKEVKKEKALFQEKTVPAKGPDFLDALNASLADVAETVKPSVVNISTTKTISMKDHPLGNFMEDPFFKKFFGDKLNPHGEKKQYKSSSLGSGVIVTSDGYILTNNHVIQDVDEIKVVLHDKTELPGKVIGGDPKSDLAIVR